MCEATARRQFAQLGIKTADWSFIFNVDVSGFDLLFWHSAREQMSLFPKMTNYSFKLSCRMWCMRRDDTVSCIVIHVHLMLGWVSSRSTYSAPPCVTSSFFCSHTIVRKAKKDQFWVYILTWATALKCCTLKQRCENMRKRISELLMICSNSCRLTFHSRQKYWQRMCTEVTTNKTALMRKKNICYDFVSVFPACSHRLSASIPWMDVLVGMRQFRPMQVLKKKPLKRKQNWWIPVWLIASSIFTSWSEK